MPRAATSVATRETLHRIAAHVLAHRRFDVDGRFGLRAGPGGIATPAFGTDPESIRISRVHLIREVGGASSRMPIDGSTLRELAAFVDLDVDAPFSCGVDTPPKGLVDHPLELADAQATEIAAWFAFAWRVLDDVLVSLPDGAESATIQLWPEHFDAATTVTVPSAQPVTLGFSPGDAFEHGAYLYVGVEHDARQGDPAFWNAPFGALRRRSDVFTTADPVASCRQFLADGLHRAAAI